MLKMWGIYTTTGTSPVVVLQVSRLLVAGYLDSN